MRQGCSSQKYSCGGLRICEVFSRIGEVQSPSPRPSPIEKWERGQINSGPLPMKNGREANHSGPLPMKNESFGTSPNEKWRGKLLGTSLMEKWEKGKLFGTSPMEKL